MMICCAVDDLVPRTCFGAPFLPKQQRLSPENTLGLNEMRYEPEHAAKALEVMERLYLVVSPQDEYVELLAILREPRRWQEAHAAFERIRVNLTLPAEMQKKQGLDSVFVYVAENAAKTAYNCSGGSAPFDEDSFEWLLKSESQFNEAFIAIQTQPVAPADGFAAR